MKKYLLSLKFWLIVPSVLIATLIILVMGSNYYIIRKTRGQIFSDKDQLPPNDVGLVLGTSRYMRNGTPNLFFRYRMDAAAELYHSGKIRHIIVSGDNHTRTYDEPAEMVKSLLQRGVPREKITCDYAGFRTLDSVVRCKKVFGQQRVTIISQRFHLERALFIADYYRMHAVGFPARDVNRKASASTRYREYLAKFKAMLDLFVLRKQPKFLGDPVNITI